MAAPPDITPLKVLIVDDQRSFAQSLELVIDSQADLESVGSVATGEEAVQRAPALQPDVVLMDLDLPGIDGIDATIALLASAPRARVVILTGHPSPAVLNRAAAAGASAFLLKDSSLEEILEAVREPTGDDLSVTSQVRDHVLEIWPDVPPGLNELTRRELEVLSLLAEGRQPKQIARALGITVQTCRSYVKNLLSKLGAHSALEAVVLAHRYGLIHLDSPT